MAEKGVVVNSKVSREFLFFAVIGIISLAAWTTHVVYCIMVEKFLLLIAGAIVAPVGVIHGIGIWMGVW